MKERHFGIDLLRIISMYMVVTLHILGYGGILASLPAESLGFKVAWLLEIAAYCSVNCYALLSGYVSVKTNFKYSRIIVLWLQVAFYTLLTTLIFKYYKPEVMMPGSLFRALTPVTSSQYWYFTAYFGMFFFIPFFNSLINSLNKKQFKILIVSLIVIFSVVQTLIPGDIFKTSGGYSMFWLIVLYFLGAYFKLTEEDRKRGKLWYLAGFVISVLLVWVYKFLPLGPKFNGNLFIGYYSPFILSSAAFLLLFCSKLKIKGKIPKFLIKTLAPASFGVYLIHTNPLIWESIIKNRFVGYAASSTPKLVLLVLVTAVAIYLACSLIDLLRIALFKLLRINKLSEIIEKNLSKILNRYIFKDKELITKN